MKIIYLFSVLFLFFNTISIGQDENIVPPPPPPPEPEFEDVFKVIIPPINFPGCEEDKTLECAKAKVEDFIYRHLVYPEEAIAKKIEGMVVLRYTINSEGEIDSAKILKDIGGGCGTSALNAVLKLPRPQFPRSARGKNVRIQVKVPIWFQLK